jgi:hypothetical protein
MEKHAPNTPIEKKLLRKRSLTETAIGKFKALFGFTLSQFRPKISAFTSISFAILAFNIPLSFRHSRNNSFLTDKNDDFISRPYDAWST